MNALLGVDGQREATIALCALGRDDDALPEAPAVVDIAYPFGLIPLKRPTSR